MFALLLQLGGASPDTSKAVKGCIPCQAKEGAPYKAKALSLREYFSPFEAVKKPPPVSILRPARKDSAWCYDNWDDLGSGYDDWALWTSYAIKPQNGDDEDIYVYSNDIPGDLYCGDTLRVGSYYSGSEVDYVLSNHNVGYIGVWEDESYIFGGEEGAYYILYYSDGGNGTYEWIYSNENGVSACTYYNTAGGSCPYYCYNSSDILGIEAGFTADAGYPGVVFDVGSLSTNWQYLFYAYSIDGNGYTGGGADMYLAVHSPSPYWQARADAAQYVDSTGTGGGEYVVFAPTRSGRHGVVVGEWGWGTGTQDTFGVGFFLYPPQLSNETPLRIPRGAMVRWVQPDSVHRWAVVGVKPNDQMDWDIMVKTTHSLSTIYENTIFDVSQEGTGLTDFIAINYHNRSGYAVTGVTWFGEITKYLCNVSDPNPTVEWCRSHGILDTSSTTWYGPFSWSDEQVAWAWDLVIRDCPPSDTSGLIVEIDVVSGNLDVGGAVFSPGNTYDEDFRDRSEALVLSDNSGPGGDEFILFNPANADTHGLVVFSENFEAGQFRIRYRCPTPLYAEAPEAGGIPSKFDVRLVRASRTGIIYKLFLPWGHDDVSLALYDISGRGLVKERFQLEPGVHLMQEPLKLSSGVYVLEVKAGGERIAKRLIVK